MTLLRHRGRLGIVERDSEVELAGAERAYDADGMPISATETSTSGIARAERPQCVDDHRSAGAGERPDPEAAGGEIGDRVELELGDGELLEDTAGTSCQRAAGLGQPQRPQPTVDERRPHLLLEPGDDLRDGGLRVVEQVGSGRERSRLAHRLEDSKLFEFHS